MVGLGSVVGIATGYGWTGCVVIIYSDYLQVGGIGSVVGIATGYGWTGCVVIIYSD